MRKKQEAAEAKKAAAQASGETIEKRDQARARRRWTGQWKWHRLAGRAQPLKLQRNGPSRPSAMSTEKQRRWKHESRIVEHLGLPCFVSSFSHRGVVQCSWSM